MQVLKGIFTGFLHRAYKVCEGKHLENEIEFLMKCFVENGYNENKLRRTESIYKHNRSNIPTSHQQ